jgi:putative peptide zinc metalloprotease protein
MAEAAARRDVQRGAVEANTAAEAAVPALYRDQFRVEAATARSEMNKYAEQYDLLDKRLRAVGELKAPRDGVVMGLPKRAEVGKLFNQYSAQERPVCQVGDPARLTVQVPASSMDYVLLSEDLAVRGPLPVDVYVAGRTDRLYRGVVRRVPDTDAKQVPIALTQRANGPLAVKSAGEQGQEITPVAKTYLVDVELTDTDASLVSGAQVAVKVHCRWRTGAWWVGRKIAEALDIGLY